MPLYAYRCPGGVLFGARYPMGSAPSEILCPCGRGSAHRVYLPMTILVRPPNYSASPSDPRYWEGIHEDPTHYRWQNGDLRELATTDEARDLCAGKVEHGVSQVGLDSTAAGT